MNLLGKLELMQKGEIVQTNKGQLAITSEMDSLARLAESPTVSISKSVISERAKEIIDDVSVRMRKRIHMVFIFDESYSMFGAQYDIKEGFQQLISKYCDENILITTVLFSDQKRVVHSDIPINNKLSLEIKPHGNTRLYDTAIETIEDFDRLHPNVTDNALFIMATDGQDNMSNIHAINKLRKLVKKGIAQGRKFYFLGDSIDAINTAEEMGIPEENAVNYSKEDHGFIANFLAIGNIIKDIKTKGIVSRDWKKPVEEHYLAIEQKVKKYEIKL